MIQILIDSEFRIIAGHGRVLAAKKIGMEEVPCLFIEHLSEEQKKAYIIADNKLALDASWDMEILKSELLDLKELNFDINLTGFDLDNLDFGFDFDGNDVNNEAYEDDFNLSKELPKEPKSKFGEVYQLGNHRLMCGDATKQEDILKLVDGKKIDLFITDPPYNVNYQGRTKNKLKIQNDKMKSDDFVLFLQNAFLNADRIMKPGTSFYIWFASKETLNVYNACKNIGKNSNENWEIKQQIIWFKNKFVIGRQDYQWIHEPCIYGWKNGEAHYFTDDRTQTTVLEYDKLQRNEDHPTMKPVKLIAKLIENSSKSNNNVLDLFGGSGTTLIACEQLNRKCFMMELDPRYVDVIIKRWEDLTNKKAVKIIE
ncbi:MAG: site-specific DNA-methyltransferase [Candidatus Improbicoccus pseudotrichonymphae]|uniref:Methyltransferase n=1 Tax=Candidatus Improbicoccus pseudotrichonymphae TaxID=3033792 RepID=A0AA48KX53_9FIRM|nr:MAG: site-specific DNA-methyltransferase [Candidatus Improbicoccus pseudotrichonymphae]